MPKIVFIDSKGARREIDAASGQSVMQTAIANNVEGIVAECNGNAGCATCHVYLDAASAARLPDPQEHEAEMLEFAAAETRPTSRLSCQVTVEGKLDGMVVEVPSTQV